MDLGLGHVVDDGGHEVGDGFVVLHFDHLGIDQDELDVVGPLGEQDGHDDGVDADGFARAGGAGDEEVGHFGEVFDERVAGGVFAEAHGEGHFGDAVVADLEEVLEADAFAVDVGDFDAHGGFAGDVVDDADGRAI